MIYLPFFKGELLGEAWVLLTLKKVSLSLQLPDLKPLPLSHSLALVCIARARLGDIPLLCLSTLDQTQLPLG